MRGSLLLVVAVAAFAVAFAQSQADLPDDVAQGYYPSRSGNVILRDVRAKQPEGYVAFLADNGALVDATKLSKTMLFSHVADVVSRVLGLAPIDNNYAARFVTADVFSRPQANLLLTVDALHGGPVQVAPRIQQLMKDRFTRLTNFSHPIDYVSAAATLATGRQPNVHGIVGPNWFDNHGRLVSAFDGEAGAIMAVNTADLMAQLFNQPLTVSFSSDPQQAMAFCRNSAVTSNSANDLCLVYDEKSASFVRAGDRMVVLQGGVDTGLWNDISAQGDLTVAFDRAAGVLSVTGSGATETFSMAVPDDAAFIAELQAVAALPAYLQANMQAALSDSVPDSFAVTLAALARIASRYTVSSSKYRMAARLVDAAVPILVKSFNALYSSRLLAEVVVLALPAHPAVEAAVVDQVARASGLAAYNIKHSAQPALKLRVSAPRLQTVCSQLNSAFGHLDVHCPSLNLDSDVAFIELQDDGDAPTDNDVQRYQIILWLSIGLALALLAIVYSLGCMDFKRDTLLYGSFNPNWNKKHQ